MKIMSSQRGLVCALALPLLLGVSAPAMAQDANIRTISRYRVKPDRDGDFRAAVKEYVAILKKANPDRSFTMWAALTGPREYILAAYFGKYAEFDVMEDPKLKEVQAELTGIAARLNACVESSERYIDEILPDLSLPRSAEIPKMVRVMRSQVKPDKVDAYTSLLKSELFPAVQKSGMKVYLTARVRLGRPSQEFSSIVGLDGWASLDGQPPVVLAMGADNYRQFVARITPLVEFSEVNVYRYLPDLSYLVAK